MLRKIQLVIVMLVFTGCWQQTFAQVRNGSVKGTIIDTLAKKPLSGATINVLDAKDSTLISFSRSKENGQFEVGRLPAGNFILLISYTGFSKLAQRFAISTDKPVYDFSSIAMTSNSTLADVTVVAAPVTIKGDTVEFNAGSFKVNQPNAVVEDLLKRLPGVEVDKDGNIKANGQDVKRILVDGKQFFGNDPKLATKNLQADMVNKVQVFEQKSDRSQFTGFDDGNGEQTINLTLKNDKRTGVFGRVAGGYGTEDRYQANANINKFKKGEQLSFIGQANNVNQQGFSVMDALSFAGGQGFGGGGRGGTTVITGGSGLSIAGLGGGQQGITSTQALGTNFNHFKNKNLDLNASYFFNGTQLKNDFKLQRETFVGDSSQFYDELGFNSRENFNHRINAAIDWKMDSSNSIIIRPSFVLQKTNSFIDKDYQTNSSAGNLLTQGFSTTGSESDGYNFSTSAFWRHKFSRLGRTFSAQVNLGSNLSNASGDQYTVNTQFKGSSINRSDTLNQINSTKATTASFGAELIYTEPVSKRSLIELSTFYRFNDNTNDRKTYDFNKATNAYDLINQRLTNLFDNEYTYAGAGVAYKENRKGWNYTIGAKAQQAKLSSRIEGKDEAISQQFFNILPNAQIQIGKNQYRNFRLFYNGTTQNPSVAQLQPIEDISDPLNITRGNPNLKQSFSNTFRINYTSFDPYTMRSFFLFANLRQTINDIVRSDSIGAFGARYTTYENVNGVYNGNISLNMGFPAQLGTGRVNINLGTSFGASRNINLLNNESNKINNYNIGQRVSAQYNHKELFDVYLAGSVLWNRALYSLQPEQNTNFFTYNADLENNWFLPKNFTIGTTLNFTANTGRAEGFNQNFWRWNAYVAKSLLKNKRGELRLSAFDILNQNTGISRVTSGNFVEDTRYTVLKRYFLFSFTYNLSKFGQAAPAGPRIMMRGTNF